MLLYIYIIYIFWYLCGTNLVHFQLEKSFLPTVKNLILQGSDGFFTSDGKYYLWKLRKTFVFLQLAEHFWGVLLVSRDNSRFFQMTENFSPPSNKRFFLTVKEFLRVRVIFLTVTGAFFSSSGIKHANYTEILLPDIISEAWQTLSKVRQLDV